MARILAAVAAATCLWLLVCAQGERFVNRRVDVVLPEPSERALALHASARIVDLHADSLLWRRDLLERSCVGHVDLPRLREGGVALQVFSAPTVVPWNANFERTRADAFDALTLAGLAQATPLLWRGPLGRAQFMAEKLHGFAARSGGALIVVRQRGDLAALAARRGAGERVVGGLLALEGAHAAEASPESLRRLHDAGYRMAGLTHFFDNAYAGSAHGVRKGGLSPLGRRTLRQMETLGMAVDLSHLAPAAIDDVLAMATRPVVVSHGGVQATCPGPRTLSDDHVRAIAANGGVIGIGYFEGAVCGESPRHVAAAVRHVVDLVGDAHVALGSDYDGAIRAGFDTSELPVLTQALLDAGLSETSLRRVLGGNAWRVIDRTLPPAPGELGKPAAAAGPEARVAVHPPGPGGPRSPATGAGP